MPLFAVVYSFSHNFNSTRNLFDLSVKSARLDSSITQPFRSLRTYSQNFSRVLVSDRRVEYDAVKSDTDSILIMLSLPIVIRIHCRKDALAVQNWYAIINVPRLSHRYRVLRNPSASFSQPCVPHFYPH